MERIGELEIVRLIGAGGFGTVYLATDHRLERKVAVKVAHPGRGDLVREARAVARLAHPNVVAIYEIGEHAGNPYLVMEYVEGATLREHLANGLLPRSEAVRIVRELAAAVGAAHREGVLHLDLTPSNVLIARDGRVRVVDFGLARAVSGPDRDHRAGTPGFMAPEQWRGEPAGPPADVWALGAIAHLLLTGEPMVGAGGTRMRERVAGPAALELPALSSLPRELAELVRRCVRKDPAQRPVAEEVERTLDAHAPPAELFGGLAALGDSAALRGRDDAIAAVLALFDRERAIAIVGASGCGKSSLVNAGVVPRLRADGWTVAVARPGRDVLAAVAAALRAVIPGAATETHAGTGADDAIDSAERWRRSPARFAADLADAAATVADRFVLVIDPLHEQASDEATAALAAAIADDAAYRILVVLREDHAARVAAFDHVYALRAPDRAGLQTILEGWRDSGLRLEPEARDAILADISDQPGALALLRLVAIALWERRDRQRATIARTTYTQLGGAAGVLTRHVRAVLGELAGEDARRARSAILRGRGEPAIVERLIDARILVASASGLAPAHRDLPARLDDEPLALASAVTRSPRRRLWWLGLALAGGAAAVLFAASRASPRDGASTGECSPLTFGKRELATVFNAPGVQDAVAAISEDGLSVASYRRDCDQPVFTPLVIDDLGGVPFTIDLTTVPAFSGMHSHDARMTLSSDGLTVIAVDEHHTGFIAARRSARGRTDFVRVGGFEGLRGMEVRHPALSPDGLAFYFSVPSGRGNTYDIYESLRPSVVVPFPPATRMADEVLTTFDFVNGISRDRLTLFVGRDFGVAALTRERLDEPFRNHEAPMVPRPMPGWRARPFAGCQKLIATCVSGCNGEDSCVFSH